LCYLVTVMDDFLRFIIAWRLQTDMTSDSFIEVDQDAVDLTGMTDVPWEHRTRLLSDNGPGYISHSFGEYLRLVGIRHILASPSHPQTNGKLERYHRTIKLDVNQIPYDVPGNLEKPITEFVNYYNNRRYHKVLGNVTRSGVGWSQGTDPAEAKGGSSPHFSAQTIEQSTPQRARRITTESPFAFCPIFAECIEPTRHRRAMLF